MKLLAFLFVLFIPALAMAANEVTPIGDSVLNQASQARAVVKSDSTVLPQTRGIFNGEATACDIALVLAADTAAVTFKNVPSGAFMPVSAIKIMSTNTTCSNASMIALY